MRSTTPPGHKLRGATLAQIENRLAPAFPSQLLAKTDTCDYSRERIFPLFRTFWCWTWQILQANTSCREVVRQVQALFALEERGAVDEATGAYCQARVKLPLPLLEKIFAATAKSVKDKARAGSALQGRPLKVLDGSSTRLADTSSNRQAYPPPKSLKKGCGFPVMKLVVLFSLASGALLARATGTQSMHEVRLCEALRAFFLPKDIILADRAYALFPVLAWLQTLQVDMIARVPTRLRRVDFRKAKRRLAPGEGLFQWQKSRKVCAFLPLEEWLGISSEITVRILRVHLRSAGFRTQQLTLVTTLLDQTLYPAGEIVAAYARRWRLEMCLDDLKTTLNMEHLHCRTPLMVEKELLVFLIAHNLLRWLMLDAAQNHSVSLEQISFKGTLDAWRQWTIALCQIATRQVKKRTQLWNEFLQTLAADLVPERPGRREPRAVKKRSKYPHLNTPRKLFRDKLSRNQQRIRASARKRALLN